MHGLQCRVFELASRAVRPAMTGFETALCVVFILALKSISKTGQVVALCGVEENVVGDDEQRAIEVMISVTILAENWSQDEEIDPDALNQCHNVEIVRSCLLPSAQSKPLSWRTG